MRHSVFLFLLTMVVTTTLGAQAFAHEVGNGGDSYSQEFVAIGRKILEQIRKDNDPKISAETLAGVMDKTRVSTKDTLVLGDAEVDALNFPEQDLIEINRSRWEKSTVEERRALVLHEYLGIAKQPDSNYQISSSYVEVPDAAAYGTSNRFEVQLRSGYASSLNTDKAGKPTGPSYGGALGYILSDRWKVVLGVDSYQYEKSGTTPFFGSTGSSYRQNNLKFDAGSKFRLHNSGKLYPFIMGGLSYFRSSTDYPFQNTYGNYDYSFGSEAKFGFFFGAGADYLLYKRMALSLNAEAGRPFATDFGNSIGADTVVSAQLGLSFLL